MLLDRKIQIERLIVADDEAPHWELLETVRAKLTRKPASTVFTILNALELLDDSRIIYDREIYSIQSFNPSEEEGYLDISTEFETEVPG